MSNSVFLTARRWPRLFGQLLGAARPADADTKRYRSWITCSLRSAPAASTARLPSRRWRRPRSEELPGRTDSGSTQWSVCARRPAHLHSDWLPRPSVIEERVVGIATTWRRVLASMLAMYWVIYVKVTPTLTVILVEYCSAFIYAEKLKGFITFMSLSIKAGRMYVRLAAALTCSLCSCFCSAAIN